MSYSSHSLARFGGALLLSVAAACSDPTEPLGRTAELIPDPQLAFQFGVHRLANEPPFVVTAPNGETLTIRGTFSVPCQPHDARAGVQLAGDTLVLQVTGEPSASCFPATQSVGYEARLGRVHRSVRAVRVEHRATSGAAGVRMFEAARPPV